MPLSPPSRQPGIAWITAFVDKALADPETNLAELLKFCEEESRHAFSEIAFDEAEFWQHAVQHVHRKIHNDPSMN